MSSTSEQVRHSDPFRRKNNDIGRNIEDTVRNRLFDLVRKVRKLEEIFPYRGPKY